MRRAYNLINVLVLCAGLSTATGEAGAQQPGERKIINRVAPAYPALARRLHVIGAVKLEVVIRANGSGGTGLDGTAGRPRSGTEPWKTATDLSRCSARAQRRSSAGGHAQDQARRIRQQVRGKLNQRSGGTPTAASAYASRSYSSV